MTYILTFQENITKLQHSLPPLENFLRVPMPHDYNHTLFKLQITVSAILTAGEFWDRARMALFILPEQASRRQGLTDRRFPHKE